EDGGELDADGTRADDYQRLGLLVDGEHLDVGEDGRVGLVAGQHARVGAGGENDLLRLDGLLFAGLVDLDGEDALLRGTGEADVAVDDGDLVLLHQEVEALGVLDDDLVLAREDVLPVELGGADVVDAVLLGVLEVVPDLGGEEHRLGGDAAYVEAGAAQLVGRLDQRGLQSILPGADGAGIACGAAANHYKVINRLCQGFAPFPVLCQTIYLTTEACNGPLIGILRANIARCGVKGSQN